MALTIPANDFGQIRVFATEGTMTPDMLAKTPEGLQALLGAALNPDFVDIVKISDLGEMRLSDYIAEGYDMTPDPVDKAAVDAIAGTAVLILSRATGGQEVTLSLADGLTHVTTYAPFAKISPPEQLTSESATGTAETPVAKPRKSDARMSGMVATYALLALFALVGLMVWVAG
ncbi:MAG: hypothetical protein AAFU41_02035 [Pseudomonadota bacterium]